MAENDAQIGRIEGELKHITADLATGRTRMHELTQAAQRVETRLQTLVETSVPQRERMIADLDEIKESLATLPALVETLAAHGKMLKDHEAFKNKSLGVISVVGGVAGFLGAAVVKVLSGVGIIK